MRQAAMILFLLWGVVHVAGGAVMLLTLRTGGAHAYLETVATVAPATAALVPPEGSPADAILAFHAWNILWVGLCVTGIAVVLNRTGSRAGYWINLALVSGADLGLLLFLVLPGIMAWSTAVPGLILWLPAGITGYLAVRTPLRGATASASGERVAAV